MTCFARDSRLIFDLGMNNGDDTAYYLARDFKVVAVEANIALTDKARKRFQADIDGERLTIVNAAMADERGETTFFVNMDNDQWSSTDLGWASRDSSRYQSIRVPCVTLTDLFDRFGVPHYLKIDVEGADQIVLAQLRDHPLLPQFISVEDCRFGYQYMTTLADNGYDAFKLLDQSTVGNLADAVIGYTFPKGASGPFGDDVPGAWLSHADMMRHYSITVRDADGNRLAPRTQWWDIHCTNRGKHAI